jgi:FkbM family methyltransferase
MGKFFNLYRELIKKILNYLKLINIARKIRAIYFLIRDYFLVLLFPSGRFVRSNGAEIFVNFKDSNFHWYYEKNLFLSQEHEAFVKLLESKEPCVIVDIGAHWGIFAAMLDADYRFSNKIKRVICIEPDPKNIPQLKKTVSKIKNFPVSIIEAAIGDCDSEIPAYRSGGSCLQTYSSIESKSDLMVPVRTLNKILSDLSIDFGDVTHIKIDIDGYEPAFFIGNSSFFQFSSPLILTEYWSKGLRSNNQYSINEYWEFLIKNYFVVFCNYPSGDYKLLEKSDFNKINTVTSTSVANLLLIPKSENFDFNVLGLNAI